MYDMDRRKAYNSCTLAAKQVIAHTYNHMPVHWVECSTFLHEANEIYAVTKEGHAEPFKDREGVCQGCPRSCVEYVQLENAALDAAQNIEPLEQGGISATAGRSAPRTEDIRQLTSICSARPCLGPEDAPGSWRTEA